MAQADRMERLLTDLLDAEQVEAGAIRLNPEPVDLAVLASEVVERAALLGERAFRLDVPAEPLVGVWDRDRLEQILENLLSNAVKYTPEGGEISVGVAVAEDGAGEAALLTVADRGQGIPAEALPHLFERFYRVEREGLAATDGVGLGLSITKALVEAMGGGIDVTSEAGHGSTFTIRLPLAGADSGAVVARGA
jgi:signal transduction histidine kinase